MSHHPRRPADAALGPATLRHLAADRMGVDVHCLACGHRVIMPAAELAARLGADYPVPEVAKRMRCGRCGGRKIETRPDWSKQSPGVTAHHGA